MDFTNYKITLCFYRIIPCFLHTSDNEESMLVGFDWYFETLLQVVIWLDEKIFKPKELPLVITKHSFDLN